MLDAPALRDLQAFLEVVQTRNLSRAAERLGVTQPSVSMAMQRLERNFGVPLLVRSKTGVSLTAAGGRLGAQAAALCEQWERTRDRVLAARHEVAGGYVIGCHTAVAGYALVFLPDLLRQHPKLYLNLVHDLSRRILEATLSMRCDLGLVINPLRHPDLVMRRLCRDQVTLFRSVSVAHVADVLICDPSLRQTQAIRSALARRSKAPSPRLMESPSLEAIAHLTALGAGIGILPRNVAQAFGLQPVMHAPSFADELWLVFRAENRRVRAIRAVGRAVVQAFAMQAVACAS